MYPYRALKTSISLLCISHSYNSSINKVKWHNLWIFYWLILLSLQLLIGVFRGGTDSCCCSRACRGLTWTYPSHKLWILHPIKCWGSNCKTKINTDSLHEKHISFCSICDLFLASSQTKGSFPRFERSLEWK